MYTFSVSAALIQKKWKGVRNCYSRELLKKKQERCGSQTNGRKEYQYFENLRFLDPVTKQTTRSVDEELPANVSLKNEKVQEMAQERKKDMAAERCSIRQNRKRVNREDDEFVQIHRKKVFQKCKRLPEESDEDRMFLLSLVSELHRVPVNRKLKLKSDIIAVISRAQQWPEHIQHQTPLTHLPHSSSVSQHFTQHSTLPENHQDPLSHTSQNHCTSLESPFSGTTSDSVASTEPAEDISHLCDFVSCE